MTQMPPPPHVQYAPPMPQPRPVNGWAITSLVCGIIGCLVITPIVAIITGIIGLGKGRRLGGRGLAITGIILGLLWIIGGLGVVGAGYYGIQYLTKESKQMTVTAINALANDDFAQARQVANLSDDEATALSTKFKAYGKCTDISINNFDSKTVNGQKAITVGGTLTFETAGPKGFSAALSTDTGALKIDQLRVD